eukprot:Gb_08446 [translate_table: standard]
MGFQGGSSEADGVTASVKKLKLPPGPRPLPIIGNLHMLGKLLHRKLRELSKKYGPIMFLRLGSVPTVVASSPEMVKEFLKTHDLIFASRPSTCVGKYIAYNSTVVAFSPYGTYWRQMRKMCLRELLSAKRIGFMKFIREEEIAIMRESVMKQCGVNGSNPVNVSKVVSTYATDIICRMAFGRKYSEETLTDSRGFKIMIQEAWDDARSTLTRPSMICFRRSYKSMRRIKAAGTETLWMSGGAVSGYIRQKPAWLVRSEAVTATTSEMSIGPYIRKGRRNLEWAMSEMLLNPSLMKKVQDELESIVGLNRMVEESDLPQLEYLKAVVKESLRLHQPGPLLIPHEAREDCIVGGYNIPRKARIIVNAFALGTDPNSWEDPEMFKPERFIGSRIDVKGQNFEVIPFGSGRRGCPGQQLATTVVEYALASLLHCFDWRLPNGMKAEDLSMKEKFGLSISRAVHLVEVPTPLGRDVGRVVPEVEASLLLAPLAL